MSDILALKQENEGVPRVRSSPTARSVQDLIKRAAKDEDVLAVILFGSAARDEEGPLSDVDVCVVLGRHSFDRSRLTNKRMSYLTEFPLDVQIFQLLPLYVRRRIPSEGRVLYRRSEDALYDLALANAKSFEDFRPIYQMYLDEVARAG